jgi:DNA-binding MarR family transcriptional regulator
MSRQVLSAQELSAWVSLLRGHAALTRALNAQLVAGHGLTLNDYEVLLHLSRAPDRRMRRVDLAGGVVLTQSGITRLLEGLERAGYVERAECTEDRRVVYAVLTNAGLEKLREAAATHLDGVRELFLARYSGEELETLGELLGRLGGGGSSETCAPE